MNKLLSTAYNDYHDATRIVAYTTNHPCISQLNKPVVN